MNLACTARVLGGVVCGHRVLAPGPGHSKHDRSLVVFIDPNSSDLFRVHSHAGDDWKTCRDHVKSRLGIADSLEQYRPPERCIPARVDDGDAARIRRALAIWEEAKP